MLRSRVLPLVVVALGTFGCTSAEVFRIDPAIRPQTHPDSVRFIAQEPTQPYTVIALVSVVSDPDFGSQEKARRRLRREAALLGGEAVLLEVGSLTRVAVGSGEYTSSARQLSGKVIVFDRVP